MPEDGAESAVAVDRPDLTDMTLEELREEYSDLTEKMHTGEVRAIDDDGLWGRAHQIWDEIRSRVDVQEPRCPECGARKWGQSMGNPKHCRGCGMELYDPDDELRSDIEGAWNEIMGDRDDW